ncbi:MAG: ABC transporter ATP-binding protein [Bacteroidales bacterium]
MSIQIKNLYKSFSNVELYKNFNITFPEGTISCILGPSGCGKTTLLNILANSIEPDSASLIGFENKVVSYIFQDPRLLPWKTVEENIDFVLSRDIPAAERERIVKRFISLVELDGFTKFYPSQLSGGMRQRVSIARAFAYPSDIILMDEPLKGLDIKLKLNLIKAFSRIWQTDKRTVIFVTHDVDEALLLGKEIIVLSRPPVSIKTQQKIDLPLAKRSLNYDFFKEVKQTLMAALGE